MLTSCSRCSNRSCSACSGCSVVAVVLDAYMTSHMNYMAPAGAGNAENCVVHESKTIFCLEMDSDNGTTYRDLLLRDHFPL